MRSALLFMLRSRAEARASTLRSRAEARASTLARLVCLSLALASASCAEPADRVELCAALAQHHVARVYTDGREPVCAGLKRERPPAALAAALRSEDGALLRAALGTEKASALAVERAQKGARDAKSMAQKLGAGAFVPGLRGLALSSQLALYAPVREPELSARERDGLAYVARALLRGAREPNLTVFPPALRRVERVEVMVLLRERGSPRLWRSARGTSIARALLTATRVARDRWREREAAMGGPLHERLLELDVEVSLLSEDGTLVAPKKQLVDASTGPQHGLGFEYKSGWHYLLPEDVKRRGNGSPYRALLALMSEQGVPTSALAAGALRVYRFVALTLGTSSAPLSGDGSPG